MKGSPKVSVITCFYNAGPYLRESIESVLGQTFGGFEYLLVNDSSTDGSREISVSYLGDRRVRLLDTSQNVGPYAAANIALKQARGEYVARLDADDVALPERLAIQVERLDCGPGIGLVAMGHQNMDEEGRFIGEPQTTARSSPELRWMLLFWNCVTHSTAMFRHALARSLGFYSPGRYAQDYDLWSRMSFLTDVVQLGMVGVYYRRTGTGLTLTQSGAQEAATQAVSRRALARVLEQSPEDPAITAFVARQYAVESCTLRELEEHSRFVLSLVEPFCRHFGYAGKERACVLERAREHAFWIARGKEHEAPLWSLRMYLGLAAASGSSLSRARVIPTVARFLLGKRGTEFALGVKRRLSRFRTTGFRAVVHPARAPRS